MGGIGKTALVLAYIYRNLDQYTRIFWLDASSEPQLEIGFTSLAEELGLKPAGVPIEKDDLLRLIHTWMANKETGGWLLVLDNADFALVPKGADEAKYYTPAKLKPFLPSLCCGNFLLTTRTPNLTNALGLPAPLVLGVLPPEDARLLLEKAVTYHGYIWNETEQQAAAELAEKLGRLPLALEQAAAWVQTEESDYAAYLAEYKQDEAALLREQSPIHGDYPATVLLTFRKNFDAVEHVSPVSADLLRLSAYLAPDNIHFDIILNNAAHLGPELESALVQADDRASQKRAMERLLIPLKRYCLVERQSDEIVYHVHRMVQAATRDYLPEAARRVWAERATEAMRRIWPKVKMETWELCAFLLPHALACADHIAREKIETEAAGSLLNNTGYFLHERGAYAAALSFFQQALEIRRAVLPEGHPDIAGSLNNLAELYSSQGRYAEAEPLHKEALEIRRTALPQGHPDIAQSLNNLASLYKAQGRYAEAEPLYKEALEIVRQALGENHPTTKTVARNYAIFLEENRRRDNLEPSFFAKVKRFFSSR